MALKPRNEGMYSPANDDGRSGGWTPSERRWHERRKSTRIYRNWDTRRPSGHLPAFARLPDIATNDLESYCVSGRFEGPGMEPTIQRIGDYFGARLNAAAGDRGEEPYPAGVLLGKFVQLAAALSDKPHPHFDDGGFATPEANRVLYRLVILPFAEDARSVDRWLALGSWRIQPGSDDKPGAN